MTGPGGVTVVSLSYKYSAHFSHSFSWSPSSTVKRLFSVGLHFLFDIKSCLKKRFKYWMHCKRSTLFEPFYCFCFSKNILYQSYKQYSLWNVNKRCYWMKVFLRRYKNSISNRLSSYENDILRIWLKVTFC